MMPYFVAVKTMSSQSVYHKCLFLVQFLSELFLVKSQKRKSSHYKKAPRWMENKKQYADPLPAILITTAPTLF